MHFLVKSVLLIYPTAVAVLIQRFLFNLKLQISQHQSASTQHQPALYSMSKRFIFGVLLSLSQNEEVWRYCSMLLLSAYISSRILYPSIENMFLCIVFLPSFIDYIAFLCCASYSFPLYYWDYIWAFQGITKCPSTEIVERIGKVRIENSRALFCKITANTHSLLNRFQSLCTISKITQAPGVCDQQISSQTCRFLQQWTKKHCYLTAEQRFFHPLIRIKIL